MCDAFRSSTEWQFLTGGQFVAHPGGDVRYRVAIVDRHHPITMGVEDFEVRSEQYYHHVDPAIHVLATTTFPVADGPHAANGPVQMPTIWTKRWGRGRVFYCAIGHTADDIAREPVRTLVQRGLLWAGNLLREE
jgi:type 1 glutamine amidotransferase